MKELIVKLLFRIPWVQEMIIERFKDEICSVEFSPHSEGCGLEDQGIVDRYEAMQYGYERGLESAIEAVDCINY